MRPHIDFVQDAALPWESAEYDYLGAGAEARILSRDSGTGAASMILHYPSGWQSHRPFALSADQELLVIEGAMSINGVVGETHAYAYLPAGFERVSMVSESGATVLTFFSETPELTAPQSGEGAAIPPFLDTVTAPWDRPPTDPEYADTGMRLKFLRSDNERGDSTFLIVIPAHWHPKNWSGPQERHDCVEEMYLLSGDLISPRGVMRPGGYFWRPPGIRHGPFASHTGGLALVRALGGRIENNWSAESTALSRVPPYDPVLPDDLRKLVMA